MKNKTNDTLTDTKKSSKKPKPCKAFMNEATTSDNTVKMVLLTKGFWWLQFVHAVFHKAML